MKKFNIDIGDIGTYLSRLSLKKMLRALSLGGGPEGDWKLILLVTTILVTAVIGVSTYVFIMIGRGEIFVTDVDQTEIDRALDIALLEEASVYYQEKAVKLEEIIRTRIQSPDPSL